MDGGSFSPAKNERDKQMIEHTAGPWYAVTGSVWTTPGGPDDGGTHVAMMDREEPKTKPVERDANAHLIAAAPDMLEALKAYLDSVDGDIGIEKADELAQKAIAKAEGSND